VWFSYPDDGETVQEATGAQSESDGAAGLLAEQVPLQPMVPVLVFVMPQEFGSDDTVQDLP
jgi:hypothetical protein